MSRLNSTTNQSTSTEVATTSTGAFAEIEQYVQGRRSFVEKAIDRHLDLDVFLSRILNEVRKNPDLVRCTYASLMGAVVTSAQLGLEVGPLGHFYLTPRQISYKDGGEWLKRWEVVPIIGYKGFIVLGRRAGGMSIDADSRCENDAWSYQRGTDPHLHTSPPDRGSRGEILGYWAAARFTGGSAAHYMSMDDLESHAKEHASNYKGEVQGFAKKDWDGWCKKTVVRQMAWKLPQSTQIAVALERDESSAYWQDGANGLVVEPASGELREEPAEALDGTVPADADPDPTLDPNWGQA